MGAGVRRELAAGGGIALVQVSRRRCADLSWSTV